MTQKKEKYISSSFIRLKSLRRLCLSTFLFATCLLVFTSLSFADQLPPSGASADVQDQKNRDDLQKKQKLESYFKESQVEVEKRPAPESGKIISFALGKLFLEDKQVVDPHIFDSLLAQYEGRTITYADLEEVCLKIESIYREQGYFAVAYVKPQQLEGEVVDVQLGVILSTMGNLYLEGVRWSSNWKLRSCWNLAKADLIQFPEIQKGLNCMNQNPDRVVKSILKAGKEPGTTDVYLKVVEDLPVHAGFSTDNQGVKSIGKDRFGFWIKHNNFLRLDDMFLIGTVFGSTYGSIYLSHIIPITNHGTRLVLGFSHTQVTPLKEFAAFGINGIAQTYSAAIRQKLLENKKIVIDGHFDFEIKEKRTKTLSVTTTQDRLRVLSLGVDAQTFGTSGFWTLGSAVSFGLPLVGDGNPLTSRQAESSFFKVNLFLRRVQKLFWGTKGMAEFQARLSPDKLTPQEQLFLGGATTVRGYPDSDFGADQAVLTNLEYSVPFFLVPSSWKMPITKQSLREAIEPLIFFDYGHGRLRDPSAREHRSRNLMGIGGGVVIHLSEHVSARVEWGVPVGDDPLTEGGGSQFHFSLKTDI